MCSHIYDQVADVFSFSRYDIFGLQFANCEGDGGVEDRCHGCAAQFACCYDCFCFLDCEVKCSAMCYSWKCHGTFVWNTESTSAIFGPLISYADSSEYLK